MVLEHPPISVVNRPLVSNRERPVRSLQHQQLPSRLDEDLRDVAQRILEFAGTPDARARAVELATDALARAATPAGRTTSLPNITARPVSGAA